MSLAIVTGGIIQPSVLLTRRRLITVVRVHGSGYVNSLGVPTRIIVKVFRSVDSNLLVRVGTVNPVGNLRGSLVVRVEVPGRDFVVFRKEH